MSAIDDILLSERIYQTWLSYAGIAVADIRKKYPDIRADEIPDEDFRELPNGDGELFVKVRDNEISLRVPSSEWGRR